VTASTLNLLYFRDSRERAEMRLPVKMHAW
jgi:hypothetical protein